MIIEIKSVFNQKYHGNSTPKNYLLRKSSLFKILQMTFCLFALNFSNNLNAQLTIENEGTKLAYIAHNGKPLFAFGVQQEYLMVFSQKNFDYTVWSKWAHDHGMNVSRTRVIQPIITNEYMPYNEVEGGKYDLTQFNPDFWKRFRDACVTLNEKDIIMHLLIFPHNMHVRETNWPYSAFNPIHNVNPHATSHLDGENHFKFWNSYSDNKALWEIQKASMEKIVEATADLDNIIYDLSHEFRSDCCESFDTDWTKAREFFNAMADVVVDKMAELRPGHKPIIGLDAEHFHKFDDQEDWNFSNPRFQLMVKGNSVESKVPTAEEVEAYREKYKKPFIIEEGSADDDEGEKIKFVSYYDTDHAIIRKFVWKWMMNRTQVVDIYGPSYNTHKPGHVIVDYDPNGQNAFEKDAMVLRKFWNSITDYPNLDTQGIIKSGVGYRKKVLSSKDETIAYMASKMGEIGTEYKASSMNLSDLSLADGKYELEIWKPVFTGGLIETTTIKVKNGAATVNLPAYTDDIVVHIYKK